MNSNFISIVFPFVDIGACMYHLHLKAIAFISDAINNNLRGNDLLILQPCIIYQDYINVAIINKDRNTNKDNLLIGICKI